METKSYYQYTKQFTNEDLFFGMWDSSPLSEFMNNPAKEMAVVQLVSINRGYSRYYFADAVIKGTFTTRIKPFGTEYSEVIDVSSPIVFERYKDKSVGVWYINRDRFEEEDKIYNEYKTDNNYVQKANVEVDITEQEVIQKIKKRIINLTKLYRSDMRPDEHFNDFEGSIIIQNVIAVDTPETTLDYIFNYKGWLVEDEKKKRSNTCSISYPRYQSPIVKKLKKRDYDKISDQAYAALVEQAKTMFLEKLSKEKDGVFELDQSTYIEENEGGLKGVLKGLFSKFKK